MVKQRGFTLIEMMIVVVILFTVGLTVMGFVGSASGNSNISWGMNGMTESRCIEGYKFIIGERGQPRQILDEMGKGVKCENPNIGKPGSFGKF